MSDASNIAETYILEALLSGAAPTLPQPTALFLALSTTAIAEDGTGITEPSGALGYSRQPISFTIAGNLASNTATVAFGTALAPGFGSIHSGAIFDAVTGGNYLVRAHLSATAPILFTSVDIAGDTIVAPAHGLSNGLIVVVTIDGPGSLPGGITAGTTYYVVGATVDTLQLSLTSGGSPVDITSTGSGSLRRAQLPVIETGGTLSFPAGAVVVEVR